MIKKDNDLNNVNENSKICNYTDKNNEKIKDNLNSISEKNKINYIDGNKEKMSKNNKLKNENN